MFLHDNVRDSLVAVGRHRESGRYIPMAGGSRSRLPIKTGKVPRYYGLIGIDEHLSESIGTLDALYSKIGGRALIPEGKAGEFVKLLLGLTDVKSTTTEETEEEE